MSRHVLITGASGNLGRAVVPVFAAAGYRISALDRVNASLPGVDFYPTDLSGASAREVINQAWAQQPIDIALLLAGGFAMGSLTETSEEVLQQQLQINFMTAWNCTQPLIDHMKPRGSGRIIFIGSKPGFDVASGAGVAAYALAKSLVFRLQELTEAEGVQSAILVPGTLDTPINRQAMPDADTTRWVKPETLAQAMLWLDSPTGLATHSPQLHFY